MSSSASAAVAWLDYCVGMLSADDLDRVALPQVRWREGCDIDEVDAFLALAREAIAAGPSAPISLTAAEVEKQLFQPTKFRLGYGRFEVDALLERVAATLRAYGA